MPSDTFSNINSIIERDKTDTPYKYSLLKSVIETCQEYPQYAKEKNSRIELPIGICVVKWLVYYYPFFLPEIFISLRGNEAGGKRQIMFRKEFEDVCRYYENHGGISVFYDEIISGEVSPEINGTLLKLIRKIRYTITDNPMRHLGYSQSNSEYSVFKIEESAAQIKNTDTLSLQLMIEKCGTYSISKELYSVFRELGGFIIGSGTISQKWMSFLKKVNADSGISESEILERFSMSPVSERNVSSASKIYHSELRKSESFCVWSDKKITESNIAIDHILPFAVWRCNDLWNLVPADSKVNLNKSDKIPSSLFLKKRKAVIFKCWDLLYEAFPKRFSREISVSLLGGSMGNNWKEEAFERLCKTSDYLIEVRGFNEWETTFFN